MSASATQGGHNKVGLHRLHMLSESRQAASVAAEGADDMTRDVVHQTCITVLVRTGVGIETDYNGSGN